MNKEVLFSKKSDNWATPKNFLVETGYYDYFDPCPLNWDGNPSTNGLTTPWEKLVFVNPPYSDIRSWLLKGISEIAVHNSKEVVFLVPARTDTKWFHELIYGRYKITFLRGRMKFEGAKWSAPFPSMLIYME